MIFFPGAVFSLCDISRSMDDGKDVEIIRGNLINYSVIFVEYLANVLIVGFQNFFPDFRERKKVFDGSEKFLDKNIGVKERVFCDVGFNIFEVLLGRFRNDDIHGLSSFFLDSSNVKILPSFTA